MRREGASHTSQDDKSCLDIREFPGVADSLVTAIKITATGSIHAFHVRKLGMPVRERAQHLTPVHRWSTAKLSIVALVRQVSQLQHASCIFRI